MSTCDLQDTDFEWSGKKLVIDASLQQDSNKSVHATEEKRCCIKHSARATALSFYISSAVKPQVHRFRVTQPATMSESVISKPRWIDVS